MLIAKPLLAGYSFAPVVSSTNRIILADLFNIDSVPISYTVIIGNGITMGGDVAIDATTRMSSLSRGNYIIDDIVGGDGGDGGPAALVTLGVVDWWGGGGGAGVTPGAGGNAVGGGNQGNPGTLTTGGLGDGTGPPGTLPLPDDVIPADGEPGGDALTANHPIIVNLLANGRLWGGGGGGGGLTWANVGVRTPGNGGATAQPGTDSLIDGVNNELLTGSGGAAGAAIRLTGAGSVQFIGNTGDPFIKGDVVLP